MKLRPSRRSQMSRTRLEAALALSIRQGWLRDLRRSAELTIDELGGFCGPVRPAQVPWSHLLDRLRHEAEQELAA